MKKINYYLGTLALAAMTLASCSSDEPMKGIDPGKVDTDQVRYLNVTIASPNPGSRADFQGATPTENHVHQMYFVFYDVEGNVVATHPVSDPNDDFVSETPANGSIDKIWSSTVPVNLSAGQNMPAYVMAFINPVSPAEILTTSMSGIENLKRRQVVANDGHFPMSNSVYYGTNPITGAQDVRMVATPITSTQLFTDPADATKYPTVEIYVERYAARIDLTLTDPDNTIKENTTDVNGWSLEFVPEYWRPNAIDVEEFIVKHYGIKDGANTNYAPTITQLNSRLQWDWNGSFRSYWACSPSYYDGVYPKVSDDITDGGKYTLHYFTYDEIKNSEIENLPDAPLQKSIKYNNGFTGSFYARESTASSSAWQNANDYNPAAVVTSAVIVGRYKIKKDGDANAQPDNTTFYLYTKTNGKYNLYLKPDIEAAMMAEQNIVLDENSHNTVKSIDPTKTSPFKVEHPSKEVRDLAGTKVAGRFVALQIAVDDQGNPATGYCFYDVDNLTNPYQTITKENVNKVNALLLTATYARQYGEGLAYFSIPIQHLGFPEVGAVDKNNLLDYKNCGAGSFGLVRNHLYTININSISGLATALRDENQPIVPPMDEQTYYISAKLNVLNWRLVNPQNVDL